MHVPDDHVSVFGSCRQLFPVRRELTKPDLVAMIIKNLQKTIFETIPNERLKRELHLNCMHWKTVLGATVIHQQRGIGQANAL